MIRFDLLAKLYGMVLSQPPSRFDLSVIQRVDPDCGTICCAMGLAYGDPEFTGSLGPFVWRNYPDNASAMYVMVLGEEVHGDYADHAATIFGISVHQAGSLFDPAGESLYDDMKFCSLKRPDRDKLVFLSRVRDFFKDHEVSTEALDVHHAKPEV